MTFENLPGLSSARRDLAVAGRSRRVLGAKQGAILKSSLARSLSLFFFLHLRRFLSDARRRFSKGVSLVALHEYMYWAPTFEYISTFMGIDF